MAQSKHGDTVSLHYTGSLADGTEFDSSRGREPLTVELGSGQIIPGLDRALVGMSEGETRKVVVAAEDAYGPRDPERQQAVPRDQIPQGIPVEPGTQLQLQTPEGHVMPVVVTASDEQSVTLDANHPLAGKELTFDVEVVSIKAA